MEKVWQDFEKWWVDTRADEIPLTKKGIAAVAFEAGLKSAQHRVQADGEAECAHPIEWRQNAVCLKCGVAVLPRR